MNLICPNCGNDSWELQWCEEYPLPLICTCSKCGRVETYYGDNED